MVVGTDSEEDANMVDLVFVLEMDARFVAHRVCQHSFVDVIVSSQDSDSAVLAKNMWIGAAKFSS